MVHCPVSVIFLVVCARVLLAAPAAPEDDLTGGYIYAREAAPLSVRDTALSVRDTALSQRDTALSQRDTALSLRGTALSQIDTALSQRDTALSQRDTALSQRDTALSLRGTALSQRDTALSQRDTALSQRATALSQRGTALSQRDTATQFKGSLAKTKRAAANDYYNMDGIELGSDNVLRYLEDRDLIQWVQSGSGQYVDISDSTWSLGLEGASRRKRSFAPMAVTKYLSITLDTVFESGTGSVGCYKQDVYSDTQDIHALVTDACHALTGTPPAHGSISGVRIWEAPITRSRTHSSHARFALRVLQEQPSFDSGLCQLVYQRLMNSCANDGVTAGGEATVGDQFYITLDPLNLLL